MQPLSVRRSPLGFKDAPLIWIAIMGFRCGTFPLHNLAPAEHYNASPYDTFPHGTSYIQGTLISQDEENRRVARCSVNVVEQISRLPVHAWEVGERIRIDELWHRRAVAVFRFAVVHMRDLESAGRTAVSSEQEAARRCVDVAALQASSVEQGWNQSTISATHNHRSDGFDKVLSE